MSAIYSDTEFSNVVAVEFPGPEADVLANRKAHDAMGEVPHRLAGFDRSSVIVMSASGGAIAAVLAMGLAGWL